MSYSIVKLFDLGGDSLGDRSFSPEFFQKFGVRGEELMLLLADVNGFYAFESSLHVFPAASKSCYTDLSRWNSQKLWKHSYGTNLESILCFAEDAFGGQFCIHDEAIHYFDPETGGLERVASTVEDWAKLMSEDRDFRTGFPLAHQWQEIHGAMPVGQRLLPKRPFVLGGEYTVENLVAYDAVKGMNLRGELSLQIRDVPDGGKVIYKIV